MLIYLFAIAWQGLWGGVGGRGGGGGHTVNIIGRCAMGRAVKLMPKIDLCYPRSFPKSAIQIRIKKILSIPKCHEVKGISISTLQSGKLKKMISAFQVMNTTYKTVFIRSFEALPKTHILIITSVLINTLTSNICDPYIKHIPNPPCTLTEGDLKQIGQTEIPIYTLGSMPFG